MQDTPHERQWDGGGQSGQERPRFVASCWLSVQCREPARTRRVQQGCGAGDKALESEGPAEGPALTQDQVNGA